MHGDWISSGELFIWRSFSALLVHNLAGDHVAALGSQDFESWSKRALCFKFLIWPSMMRERGLMQVLMISNLCQLILDFMNEPITEITIQQKEFKKKPSFTGCSFTSSLQGPLPQLEILWLKLFKGNSTSGAQILFRYPSKISVAGDVNTKYFKTFNRWPAWIIRDWLHISC